MVMPWGKYQYRRMPMGIKNCPDIFQKVMNDLLGDLEYIRVYLDDILIISHDDYANHIDKLRVVFQRLNQIGFKINIKKCICHN